MKIETIKAQRLYDLIKDYKYVLLRDAQTMLPIGINVGVIKLKKPQKDLSENGHTRFLGVIKECSFHEYISHKIHF